MSDILGDIMSKKTEKLVARYNEENDAINTYEHVAQNQFENKSQDMISETEETSKEDYSLGYRFLNQRVLNMEKTIVGEKGVEQTLKAELAVKAQNYSAKKKSIEDYWHKNTATRMAALNKKAPQNASSKTREYYKGFSLQEMEDFIKNSDRGGNSLEYNSVATDLELFNRITQMKPQDANEEFTQLKRLQESCDHYLKTRRKSPWGPSGKRRRAMIEHISEKVDLEIYSRTKSVLDAASESYQSYEKAETVENAQKACKAHYDLMYHFIKGNITSDDEKTEEQKKNKDVKGMTYSTLDNRMAAILKTLYEKNGGYDDNQSPVLCTKFFNAIGWADHKPKVEEGEWKWLKKSPLKNRLAYHCISPVNEETEGVKMAKQLMGDGKQYYSDGMIGRGTYLGVTTDDKTKTCDYTKKHIWENYGKKNGSVQLSMCFNENMRKIKSSDLKKKIAEKMEGKFGKTVDYINRTVSSQRARTGEENLSILAAILGYNTIEGSNLVFEKQYNYFVTFDRKALTVLKDLSEIKVNGVPEMADEVI